MNDLIGVGNSTVTSFDSDNDGLEDILVTGRESQSGGESTKLYINNGVGSFDLLSDTPFVNVYLAAVAVADINSDGKLDVFLSGMDSLGERVAHLYVNQGNNNYEIAQNNYFQGVSIGSATFSDIDQDGDNDLFVTGLNSQIEETAILYINNGNGEFLEATDTPFVGVVFSSSAFSDVNNDGSEDLLIAGLSNNNLITKLYLNIDGDFFESEENSLAPVREGTVNFFDYNNDSFIDVFVTGSGEYSLVAKLYENMNGESFTEVFGTPFHSVIAGDTDFADVDNNGLTDVLITGGDFQSNYISKVYLNQGNGIFSEMLNTPFTGVVYGSASFLDVDNNGLKDIILSGCMDISCTNPVLELYINADVVANFSPLPHIDSNPQFEIFPNPTKSSKLFIKSNSISIDQVFISIFDVNGRIVVSSGKYEKIEDDILSMDITSLLSGQYYIQILNKESLSFLKLTIIN